jgi:nucleoside-diphosphate-sugar epimerase
MTLDVLVTGAYGTCGTAIIDHLDGDDRYEFTYLNRSDRPADHEYGGYDTVVANVDDYAAIRPAFDDADAVVHLAAWPSVQSTWDDVFEPNILGTQNVLRAAEAAEVESVVFASTNHVVGAYEDEYAPEIYERDHDLLLDHESPVRPDSFYGMSKAFGEDLGRHYVENRPFPERFYALRICSVRDPDHDHPYGDAERGVENGDYERWSPTYERRVKRMKAMWQSRRDFAHEVACCLDDDSVAFGVFSGVSDNRRRWFDLEYARSQIGYDPVDDGEEYDEPPAQG